MHTCSAGEMIIASRDNDRLQPNHALAEKARDGRGLPVGFSQRYTEETQRAQRIPDEDRVCGICEKIRENLCETELRGPWNDCKTILVMNFKERKELLNE